MGHSTLYKINIGVSEKWPFKTEIVIEAISQSMCELNKEFNYPLYMLPKCFGPSNLPAKTIRTLVEHPRGCVNEFKDLW